MQVCFPVLLIFNRSLHLSIYNSLIILLFLDSLIKRLKIDQWVVFNHQRCKSTLLQETQLLADHLMAYWRLDRLVLLLEELRLPIFTGLTQNLPD